jgi:hypothetical protein
MTTEMIATVNTILLTIVTVAAGHIILQNRAIWAQVAETNGRVTALETWREGHERWQAERNASNEREHGALHASIETNRRSVDTLRADTYKLQRDKE